VKVYFDMCRNYAPIQADTIIVPGEPSSLGVVSSDLVIEGSNRQTAAFTAPLYTNVEDLAESPSCQPRVMQQLDMTW
jgi:hypothetical protein